VEPNPWLLVGAHHLGLKSIENIAQSFGRVQRVDKMKLKRSQQIIMTNEARVLRQLRLKSGLSMWKSGRLLNLSDAYISHIETGRMNVPTGERLKQLLNIYGITLKGFFEQVRNYQEIVTPKDELRKMLDQLGEHSISALLVIAQKFSSLEINKSNLNSGRSA
jgi:transcriptional regulator with XRE-family HTH domain